ncbi:MAG: hypothetical protein FWH29_01295 [Methanobrevibacter sp.]|nr:hypothetical protein [Methanobrevibacter sp.]
MANATKINIEPDLFIAISKIAKNNGTTKEKIVNDILKKEIHNKKAVFERIERLTNGKIKIVNKDTFNPNPTENESNSIVGIMEALKGFNVVETVNDARIRKWK